MDQFTDDLRRELRRAALREEQRRALPRLRVPSELLPRIAVAACTLFIALVGVTALRTGGEREVAVDTAVLPAGTYAASLFPADRPDEAVRYELRLAGGRYELRAGGQVERSGALEVEGDVASFGSDGSCGNRDRGIGLYRVRRNGERVTFRVIDDPCEGRASVLTSPEWTLSRRG